MEVVGFGIFGRPDSHKYISNGLFKSLKLEGETYLDLGNNIFLDKGDRIVKVSRHVDIRDNTEIIKIYIFDYAEDFHPPRPGGFIGSAYVFKGEPTRLLLYNAIQHIHPKTKRLLDKKNKFTDNNFNISEKELINPNTKGLIIGKPQYFKKQIKNKLCGVLTNGPVLNHLISVVEGFILNPDYNTLASIYVSDNKKLLQSIIKNDEHIYGVGHLLDYKKILKDLNTEIRSLEIQIQDLQKTFESNQEIHKNDINNLENKISVIKQTIKNKENELNDLLKEIENKKEELKNYTTEKSNQLKTTIQNQRDNLIEIKKEIKKHKEKKYQKFITLINDSNFEEERKKYINDEFFNLENEKDDLEKEIVLNEKDKLRRNKNSKIVIVTFSLLFYMLGSWFSPISKINKFKNKSDTEIIIVDSNKNEFTFNLKEYGIDTFLALDTVQQNNHKASLDSLLTIIESQNIDTTNKEFEKFLKRKWNFAEILDLNEDKTVDTVRDKRIVNIYKENNMPVDFFEEGLMISELNSTKYIHSNISFNNSDHNEMLEKYLAESQNIYKDIQDKKNELLVAHFIWTLNRLNDNDLNKNSLKVPLLKN